MILREAHFFWCTRVLADFRFGLPLLNQIHCSDKLRETVKPHLHLTQFPPSSDGIILWREAVKRWNVSMRDTMDRSQWPSCWHLGMDMVMAFTDTIEGGVPIVLGRPKLHREIRRVGKMHHDVDIHSFVCGNKQLVASLRSICQVCTERDGKQKYIVHKEKFD
mmetsp:Transcript_22433/g.50537  ORF Transcript_22433/g.50537 Transcript_22433/m.50537 type:complete len:163 (+) Transcript_22433:2-490(+)